MSAGPQDAGSAEAPAGEHATARHGRFALRTLLISSLTLVSRISGYAREMLSAWLFGDRSSAFDAFITALRVPNLFRRFLGEGALATSFQTVLTEVDVKEGDRSGARLFRATSWLVLSIALAVCCAVMVGVQFVPDHMPGTEFAWLGSSPAAVRELTARLMPFVVLACLTATAAGALHVRGHFAWPAISPVLLNLVWIGALAALGLRYGTVDDLAGETSLEMVRWLSWAVLLAGSVQLLVLVPALRRFRLLEHGAGDASERALARKRAWGVLKRSAPLAFGAAVYQVNVMVDGLMAQSLLAEGGPTLHYYANRVQQFPMALVAVAATSAVFPALAALGQAGRRAELRALHDRTQRAVLFVALPASFGLFALATPIIAVSFERGAFGPEGVERAADGLRMLALAIVPAGAVGLVSRTYYALGDFRTPVRISSLVLVANFLLNLVFVVGLRMDVDGLALATAISSALHLAWLLPGLARRLGLPAAEPGLLRDVARMLLAATPCGLGAALARALLEPALGRGLALLVALCVGLGVFALASELLSIPEWRELRARLRARAARFRKKSRA